ncbi:MAG: hypothetical protein HYV29_10510 [Ignavibacteriales bacterium]|nr:hypothetical protein [Ignavibacteriales bacterium]
MENYNDQNRPLEPEQFYHIYNRGNQGMPIFYSEDNYRYFLSRYERYISGYADTFAYCLLPNHFHFFVRIHSDLSIKERSKIDFPDLPPTYKTFRRTSKDLENLHPHEIVSERFRRFFLGYAKALNKQEGLSGSLFKKYFQRKKVDDEIYFARLIYYIHTNPLHHGILSDWSMYPWSSYRFYDSHAPIRLNTREVVDWFGGKEQYIYFHQQKRNTSEIAHIIIEE